MLQRADQESSDRRGESPHEAEWRIDGERVFSESITVGPHDLRIELCDGRFVWASAEAMIPPEGGAVLVTA